LIRAEVFPLKREVCSQHRKDSTLDDVLDRLVRPSTNKSIVRKLAPNLSYDNVNIELGQILGGRIYL
jgi:hypothetical protein